MKPVARWLIAARRGRRERSDGGAGLPHRRFGGKSVMEQAVGGGFLCDHDPFIWTYVIAVPTRCPMT